MVFEPMNHVAMRHALVSFLVSDPCCKSDLINQIMILGSEYNEIVCSSTAEPFCLELHWNYTHSR